MNFNNIKLAIDNQRSISIAQHFEGDEMVINEIALIDESGLNEPIRFPPDVWSLLTELKRFLKKESGNV